MGKLKVALSVTLAACVLAMAYSAQCARQEAEGARNSGYAEGYRAIICARPDGYEKGEMMIDRVIARIDAMGEGNKKR